MLHTQITSKISFCLRRRPYNFFVLNCALLSSRKTRSGIKNLRNLLAKFPIFEVICVCPFHFLLFGALQTCQIDLGNQTLTVEIADTAGSQSKGLMGRDHLEEGNGMLFIYKTPSILSFWMKNTKIPLSIGFFDETKQLIETFDMPPPRPNAKRLPLFQSSKAASYALEVPQSWFQTHNILPGMKFSFHDPINPVE